MIHGGVERPVFYAYAFDPASIFDADATASVIHDVIENDVIENGV